MKRGVRCVVGPGSFFFLGVVVSTKGVANCLPKYHVESWRVGGVADREL